MLKSRLQKLEGLTHKKLKENIEKVIKEILKEKYENTVYFKKIIHFSKKLFIIKKLKRIFLD